MNTKSLSATVFAVAAAAAFLATAVTSQSVAHAQEINPQTVLYGEISGEKLPLDIYQPAKGDAPHPGVVLIHGGAGSFGKRTELSDHAAALASAGYVVFNIDYRLLRPDGSNQWPAQLDDAQLAVRWVRANASRYNADPERICAFGHSFGGQLAALLGMRDTPEGRDLPLAAYSSRVACVIDIAGPVDPTQPLPNASVQPATTALMGGTAKDVPERYNDSSPLAQVAADTAPFLIFHGTNDKEVSVEDSRRLVEALHANGVAVVYAEFPSVGHFDWIKPSPFGGWSLAGPETLAFLEQILHYPN